MRLTRFASLCLLLALPTLAQNKQKTWSSLVSTNPAQGDQGVALVGPMAMRFTLPIDPDTLSTASVSVQVGGVEQTKAFHTSLNRRTAWVTFPEFLPAESTVDVVIDGAALLDPFGRGVDVDRDGLPGGSIAFQFQTGVGAPMETGPAVVLGSVIDENGAPLQDAEIDAVYFPSTDGDPPLTPPAMSLADGSYEYTTVDITGSAEFLVRVRKNGSEHSETLKKVTLYANSCFMMDEAQLVPLSPKEFVGQGEEKTLTDPTGEVEIYFPAGATTQPGNVGITVLPSDEVLRDDLPQLVASNGVFVDVAGVFGDSVDVPVRMRVPNTYDLPIGTRLPLGKVDHNTLEWIDLREAYEGPGDPPDNYLAEVVSDGNGGSVIEIFFDHFCTVCTGYCLPIPCDQPIPNGQPCDPPPSPTPPGPGPWPPCPWSCGNSIVTLTEGFLYEWIPLPGFTEMGERWNLELGYASHVARPTVSLRMQTDMLGTRPVERTIQRFQVEGVLAEAAYGYTDDDRKPRGLWHWDGVDGLGVQLGTGSYPYIAQAITMNAKQPVSIPDTFGGASTASFNNLEYPDIQPLRTAPLDGRAVILNGIDSPYGAGWTVTNEARLYFDPDGCVLQVYGNAGWRLYLPDPADSQAWLPADDGAILTRDAGDGSFQRTLLDGTVEQYDAAGLLKTTTTRDGHATQFQHDGSGRLTMVTSPTGNWYSLTYDGGGKLTQIADSAGRVTLFTVTGGELTQITDAEDSIRTFEYDADHRLTAQNGSRGERAEYDYHLGRVSEARAYDVGGSPLLRRRTFSPSAVDQEMGDGLASGLGSLLYPMPMTEGHVDSMGDGLGYVRVHETDTEMRTSRQVDPLGRVVSFDYDAAGNLTRRVKPDGTYTDSVFNAGRKPTSIEEYRANQTLHSGNTLEWNGPFGQLSRVVDPAGRETQYLYDALGRLVAEVDDEGGSTDYTYDDLTFPQLPTRVDGPSGEVVEFTYDGNGNVATESVFPDQNPRTTTFTYDSRGNLTQRVDPENGTHTYLYDDLDRVTLHRDENLAIVTYSYDDTGCGCTIDKVTEVGLPGGGTLKFTYDGLGRLISSEDQLGASRGYAYDAEGRITQETRRDGATIDYEYDDVGNLVRKELSTGEIMVYEYDAMDRLVRTYDGVCDLRFSYDLTGAVTQARTELELPLGNALVPLEHTLDYAYDAAGNRTSMTDSAGVGSYSYEYDDLHRLTRVVHTPTPNAWTLGYDASGRRTSLLPEVSSAATSWSYDPAGNLTSILHGTTPALGRVYDQYDGTGAVENVSETLTTGAMTRTAEYDDGHRLTRSGLTQPFGEFQVGVNSTYDLANRLTSDSEFSYTYDAEGRLATRTGVGSDLTDHFTYDAEGRLVELRQEWDDNGSPVDVMTTSYCYDPLGRRVAKDVNGVLTRYVYDGPNLLHEIDRLDRVARHFTYGAGLDDVLAVHDEAEGVIYDAMVDRLGSVIALADGTGAVVQEYLNDEFGALLRETDPSLFQPAGFTGRLRDPESGLYDYRARLYEPRTGRFLSEDPLRLEGGRNFYTYVENDPLNRVDPNGLFSCQPPRCVLIQRRVCRQRRQGAGANQTASASVQFLWTGPPLALAPPPPLPVPLSVTIHVARGSSGRALPNGGLNCRTESIVLCFR